jgi:DHA1 family bicyclomycin/chloramphenicol resistance-like MFS transporter
MQLLLATASAGVLIPLLWHHPLWLALGMAGYLAIGFVCVWKTPVWKSAM